MAIDVPGRLATAVPADFVRGCMYSALFSVVRRFSPSADVTALDPDRKTERPAFQDYPVADYLRVLSRAVALVADAVGGDDAFLKLVGRESIQIVASSPMAAKVLEMANGRPEALLKSFQDSSRPLLVGYGSRTLAWEGDKHARIHYRRGILPAAVPAGMYEGMLEFIGATGVSVAYRELADFDQDFEIKWTGVRPATGF